MNPMLLEKLAMSHAPRSAPEGKVNLTGEDLPRLVLTKQSDFVPDDPPTERHTIVAVSPRSHALFFLPTRPTREATAKPTFPISHPRA
ncbi:hypothetical protein MPNT_160060 [Candidatus Methylacidithermus pantelleriae]|uniref:Uncharacterized protein n=1 Tax=Candidatus Methylacidithermus pantelleriae TaxID=2744239 RepID=A0A8J2FRW1_9BACT|nr:hypothetical protein MPNT_160060 [Candidatus Methylacidithermus pantelleriae]